MDEERILQGLTQEESDELLDLEERVKHLREKRDRNVLDMTDWHGRFCKLANEKKALICFRGIQEPLQQTVVGFSMSPPGTQVA